jgi:hypothetical protein
VTLPVDQLAQETAAKARTLQIRPALREAIRLYVTEGLSKPDAALRAGMTLHGLLAALKKPHVRVFESSVKAAWMDSRTSKAWLNIAELADKACSEDVRLKANRVFLEAAGELGGPASDPNATARTLVQIVINAAHQAGHLPADQMSGVIESSPYRVIGERASNSDLVGRPESEPEDGV